MSKSNDDPKKRGPARGGLNRAKGMTPEERAESARRAAEARWGSSAFPRETHEGTLKIGVLEIPCSVLENGTRVFSTRGVNRAFGSAKTGTAGRSAGGAPQLPAFLTSQSISPFISEELSARLKSPIVYRPKRGGRTAIGYEVTILPRICEAILDARKAGKLRTNQEAMADAAEKLVRAFAKVGIIALVDEATGYQKDRGSDELRRLLEAYVLEEFRPWVKTFPEEFFRQIYRLYGWEYRPGVTQGPRYVGKIIDKYVYQQLPPGIRDALRERNPSVNGQRKHKHFQLLTTDTGNSHLDKQIVAVVTTMKLSDNKAGFERNFKRLYGKQTMLALPEPEKPTS